MHSMLEAERPDIHCAVVVLIIRQKSARDGIVELLYRSAVVFYTGSTRCNRRRVSVGKITCEVRRGGNIGTVGCTGRILMGVLKCSEEKEFVSAVVKPGYAHRSAKGAAVLVLVQSILRCREEVFGVNIVIADELKRRSMKGVRTRLGDNIHHATSFITGLATQRRRLHAELSDCVGKGRGPLVPPM